MKILPVPGPLVMASRLTHAGFTFPSFHSLKHVFLAAFVLNMALLGLGISTGLYRWQPIRSARLLGWYAAYIMMRSLTEETVFRGILLPQPKVDGPRSMTTSHFWVPALLSVVLFAVSHAWTTPRPSSVVLRDVKFLATAATAGIACTWAYHTARGGLWAPILMHFLVVYPWVVLLGGYRTLHGPSQLKPATVPGTRQERIVPAGATKIE